MSITAGKLVNLALLDSGVLGQGQLASAEDTYNAFLRCNMMIAQWARRRWLIWNLTDVSFVSTGAESYTVGTGQNFNIARPNRLENGCFMRQLNQGSGLEVDYPLQLLPSHEDYSRIRLKTMGTFPELVFYDSAYPVANVYFWPVPQANIYELHILVKTPLTQFTGLAQTLNMPDEYQAAILYNLQKRLRAAYRFPPAEDVNQLAFESLEVIKTANMQVPRMVMPGAVIRHSPGYNVYSDSD